MKEKLLSFIKENYTDDDLFVGSLQEEYIILDHLDMMDSADIFPNCRFGSQDIENIGRVYAYISVGNYDLVFDWDVDFTDCVTSNDVIERLISYESLATELANKYN